MMGYLKIENLYRNVDIMAFRECYALEKVHGTSAHVQWSKGKVSLFSGGEKHEKFAALFDMDRLAEVFRSMEHSDDVVVRIHGEAYGGKQQGMRKTYGDKCCFIAFDVRIGDLWLNVPDAQAYCEKFGIEFVPWEKVPTTQEALNAERDRDSIVAIRRGMGKGHIREGVVLRPPFEVRLNNGGRVISKHKREEFRETGTIRTDLDPDKLAVLKEAEAIADEWCVPMRLHHVLGKLELDGKSLDMRDVPLVIKAMVDDIYVEAKGEIVESKDVSRAIGHKTVQLFKRHLAEKNGLVTHAR